MSPRDEFDIDALLREPTERLMPPDGTFELISKRAGRRKWMKAAVGVSAGVVIAAGAVPAVIAVRHNSSNGEQQVSIGSTTRPPHQQHKLGSPGPSERIVPPSTPLSSVPPAETSLVGFRPDSLSFVSASVGFLWGSIDNSRQGVVAKTTNDGASWTRLPQPPPVVDSASGKQIAGDSQIRFVNGNLGFVFGQLTYVTTDGGESWTLYSVPGRGYVDDLESVGQRFWALIRPSPNSTTVRLYSATATQPSLQLVRKVKPMTAAPGADAIALNDTGVAVIAGSSAFWSSPDGTQWTEQTNPCKAMTGVQNTELSTLNLGTVVAACGSSGGSSGEQKASYVSHNWGKSWTATVQSPGSAGSLQTLFAGTGKNIVIGTTQGAQMTTDAGRTWAPLVANGVPLGFIGYISPSHLVAVSDRAATEGAFATSTDSGRSWTVYSFGS